jgi:hypothetical protein
VNSIAVIASKALSTCPRTSWLAGPLYDYPDQRLSVETIQNQLRGQALSAKSKVLGMVREWGATGKWPRVRNAPVYFLREALFFASSKVMSIKPLSYPPRTTEETTKFIEAAVDQWYDFGMPRWAEKLAKRDFDLQELIFSAHHPLE